MDYEGAAFPKGARTRNKGLLAEVRKMPCLVCFARPCDAHHVVSRKAGGGDTTENVMPLCRRHHQEWHRIGRHTMAQKYPAIGRWIERMK